MKTDTFREIILSDVDGEKRVARLLPDYIYIIDIETHPVIGEFERCGFSLGYDELTMIHAALS